MQNKQNKTNKRTITNNLFKHPDICIHGNIQILNFFFHACSIHKHIHTHNSFFKNKRKLNLPIKHTFFSMMYSKALFLPAQEVRIHFT